MARKGVSKTDVISSANALVEKHDPIYVCDFKETLILAEESQ